MVENPDITVVAKNKWGKEILLQKTKLKYCEKTVNSFCKAASDNDFQPSLVPI